MYFRTCFLMILSALLLTACTATAETETAPPESQPPAAVLSDRTPSSDPLQITDGGTHTLTGTYDGMVVIDAGSEDVTLVLDGADITSSGKAAVYVRSAGNVTVTLADGSENRLTGKKGIHSEAALTLDGGGKLTVDAAEGHGIIAKAAITAADGTYVITAAKDGIHAENEADPALGSILFTGGNLQIVSEGDGVSASGALQSDNVQLLVNAGGGPENAQPHQDDMMGFGGGRGFFGGWGQDSAQTAETTDENAVTSFKALKSGGDMRLNGGMFTLGAADDTIHTDANLTITDGTYHLSSGDDAVHAEFSLVIDGGLFQILESYEGIEAKTIDVNGGELNIRVSDDGFNASGGSSGTNRNPMAAEDGVYFRVSGGSVFLNAEGDGLDSNGDFIVTGGTVYVSGPTASMNGALDYGGNAEIHGGTVIAAGASGMAESFGANSTQGAIMVNTGNQKAGAAVTLTDESGNVLAEYTPQKNYSNVVISCPGITDGGTYTVTAGTYTETITMNGLRYGSGGFGGGMPGGMNMGGGRGAGGKKPDNRPETGGEMPDMPGMPEGFDPGAMGGGSGNFGGFGGQPPQMP
ncbi:MAG: carbohydrate-binding domain-containing protein [Clostridia bacterium]|nr:carbohydrate-binding domain-containing protein [Clostridia bacterium]